VAGTVCSVQQHGRLFRVVDPSRRRAVRRDRAADDRRARERAGRRASRGRLRATDGRPAGRVAGRLGPGVHRCSRAQRGRGADDVHAAHHVRHGRQQQTSAGRELLSVTVLSASSSLLWLVAWSSGSESVFGRCAFAVLRSTCS